MKKHNRHGNNPFSKENYNGEKQDMIDNNEEINEEIKDDATETPDEETEIQEEAQQTNDSADKLQQDYDNLNNQYVRLAADFENFRKRQSQERESLLKYGTEEALKKVIEVLDNFDRAQKSIDAVEDCGKLKEVFNILHKQTVEALEKMGLEEIKTEGEKFDPNFHEAVMQTPSTEQEEDTIINELQKGYKFNDKVLRAALVNVAVQ
ncbi:MAG: nucleotide exchange factor GrpE [Candidatus Gastranaerophilales bacterium]|nr:nucleotide exchange factor GrpE [Candidatus Gastranaerophilales bacterium]